MSSNSKVCPICSGGAKMIQSEREDELRKDLGNHFGTSEGLSEIEIRDYQIMRCDVCTLEYASPMEPGSASFYEWVCRQPAYYPSNRWEYSEFDSMIENAIGEGRRFRVLDIGCGSGLFLRRLKDKYGAEVECVGIDITPGALSQADQKEILFILGDHREVSLESIEAFDLVTSFHCLEHVADPLGFVRGMVRFVRPGGTTAISTPLSPMSFEFEWGAIMNRPPHHMSRWNEKAYSELASGLGLGVEFRSETPSGALGRASNSVNKAVNGYKTGQSKLERYIVMFMNPIRTIRHLVYQLNRPKLNGRARGEDILAIFTFEDLP